MTLNELVFGTQHELQEPQLPLPCKIDAVTPFKHSKEPCSMTNPKSKSITHFLSQHGRTLGNSQFKIAGTPASSEHIINLGIGRPNATFYPWQSASFELSESAKVCTETFASNDRSTHDFATALNYPKETGTPNLIRFLAEHMKIVHNPPYSNWSLSCTAGSTAAIHTSLRIFCDVGDTVLAERLTYPGFLEAAKVLGIRVQGVNMDHDGLRSDDLDRTLCHWRSGDAKKPKVLYTIPSGQNPTGCTQSRERREAIYRIAEKHDLLIIEDDPYYMLDLEISNDELEKNSNTEADKPSCFHFPRLPSLLSLDSSGRVVRLDSFSKILSPGLRVGWVTASAEIIEKFAAYNEIDATPNGPSQLMISRLLESSWSHHGFFSWLSNMALQYRRRREIVVCALQKYLPRELYQVVSPSFGMFLWIGLDVEMSLRYQNSSGVVADSCASKLEADLALKARQKGVQITVGSLFAVDKVFNKVIYLRVTYAAAAESELEDGVRLLAESIMEVFGLRG